MNPHRSSPLSIKSQAEMQARDGPLQLPCVWRPANTMTEDRQVDLRRHTSKGFGCGTDYADLSCSKPLPCRGVRVHIGITSRSAVLRDAPLRAGSGPPYAIAVEAGA